jgi:hypothetical protein
MHYLDYTTEPIGGGNPYYRCIYCKRSVPQINGDLNGHSDDCDYRVKKEKEISQQSLCDLWLLFSRQGTDTTQYPETELESLIDNITGYSDDSALQEAILEQLLELEVGIAKAIFNRRVVKISVPWSLI